mgnify:CR=1 FL=1
MNLKQMLNKDNKEVVTHCTLCGGEVFEENQYICDKCEEDIKSKYESEEDEEQEVVKHIKLVKRMRKFDR